MTRRGEGTASFEAEGKTWTLRFDFNAMADFEAATGKAALDALEAMESGKARAIDIRALFWAAMQEHHPDVSLRDAGRLVAVGMKAFQGAVSSALPNMDDAEEAESGKPKATMIAVA